MMGWALRITMLGMTHLFIYLYCLSLFCVLVLNLVFRPLSLVLSQWCRRVGMGLS